MKTTNILFVVSMMAIIITSGCISQEYREMSEELNYISYPITYVKGTIELNYTEVMNINNTTFPYAKFKELNYSTYRVETFINNTTKPCNVEVKLWRNTTDFKYGGELYVYIYMQIKKIPLHTPATGLD